MTAEKPAPRHLTRARRDAIVIAVSCVVVLVASIQLDVFETVSSWVLKYRETGLDEVITALVFLAFALVVYAVRRNGEARLEAARSDQSENMLLELTQALSQAKCSADALTIEVEQHAKTLVALREAERIAGVGNWEWTVATGTVTWSKGLNHLLARDSALPAPSFEALPQFYTPESWARLSAVIASAIETGAPYELELEVVRADGTTCWTTTRGEAIREADGSVVKLRGTIHDIDKRRGAERAADQERTFNQAAVDSLPGLFYLIDRHGHFRRWNRNLEKVSGYSTEEISRLPAVELFQEPDRSIVAGHIALISTGGEAEVEAALVAKDRTQTPYLFYGTAFPFEGEPCMLGLGLDITARRRAEAELRLQSAALNAASQAMVITGRNGTIEWVNPAFAALTGYTADEAVGEDLRILYTPGSDTQGFYKNQWDTVLAGSVWRGEMTSRRKDGSLYPEEMIITPVKGAGGEVTHLIAVKRDLTEEKTAEARFLQSQKMEVVGRLAGGIAHDFNNLLTVINGTAELATASLHEGDPLRADLDEIRQAAVRAASLTRQLLAFSRKQVLRADVLSLHHLVEGLESMLRRLIGEDVTLVVASGPGAGRVKADAGQFEQVVLNLAVNARDAMPNGGVLTITTENVELDQAQAAACECPQPGPHVRVAVSDTGTGMDEATRRRVFEPFFTTKEQGKGTGLGLSTVYGIVAQSGGGIVVDSEPGRGSTFTIYLPRVADAAVAGALAVTAPAAAAAGTILVVEDENGLRRLIERMLKSSGYTVLTASDGAEALLILEHHEGPVHLMLTDVVMPKMSGPELAARLVTIRPQTRVLFSSGHTDNAALRAGVLNKSTHFIGKPYEKAELIRKVQEVLEEEPEAVDQAPAGRHPHH